MSLLDPDKVSEQQDIQYLRQSTIGNIGVCGLRAKYDRDPNLPFSTGPHREFGTAYHAGLEAHYNGEPPIPAVTAHFASEEAQSITDWGDDWVDAEQAEHHCKELVTAYTTEYSWLSLEGIKLIGAETMIKSPLPGHDGWAIQGQLDLVLDVRDAPHPALEDYDHVIVDHKTARKPWNKTKHTARKTLQPSWYTYWWPKLWLQQTGFKPRTGFVFDIMPQSAQFERRFVDVTEAQQQAALLKADAAVKLIESDGLCFPNTDSFLCSSKWCDFYDICPFGRALGS